jgi:hypothetical protein
MEQHQALARYDTEKDAPGHENLANGGKGRYAPKCILVAVLRADAPRR